MLVHAMKKPSALVLNLVADLSSTFIIYLKDDY